MANKTPASFTVKNCTIGTAPAIKWMAWLEQCYTIEYKLGNWSHTTGAIFPLGTDPKGELQAGDYFYDEYTLPIEECCKQLPKSVTGKLTITLNTFRADTISGKLVKSTKLGSTSKEITVMIPTSVGPTIKGFAVTDAYPFVVDSTTYHVQGRSQAFFLLNQMTITAGTGATLSKAEFIIQKDGEQVQYDTIGGSYIASTQGVGMTLKTYGDEIKLIMRVVDSRGSSVTRAETWKVHEYSSAKMNSLSLTSTKDEDETSNAGSVTVTLKSTNSSVDSANKATLVVTRYPISDPTQAVEVARFENLLGEQENSFTETISDLKITNYSYKAVIEDSLGGKDEMTGTVRTGLGNRFAVLESTDYYAPVNDQGEKVTGTLNVPTVATIENGVIKYKRDIKAATAVAGVGIPVKVEPLTKYELTYSAAIESYIGGVAVAIGWFTYDEATDTYDYITTTDVSSASEAVTAPDGADWGLIVFYSRGIAEYEITSATFRKIEDNVSQPIPWMLETGEIGLTTPNQKYVSRIQLRAEFEGTMKVSIKYDSGRWNEVYSRKTHELKSFTVPIRVKRCDHMKIRLEGEGTITLYSIGYITDEGSEVCLI